MGEKNFLRKTLSLQRWAFPCKVWDACRNDVVVPWMVFQPKASSWLINNLDECWHDAHNQSKDNSQKKLERKSFMMNQAVPHLGAGSSLMNDASSNCWRQPGMGIAFIAEWMASTWMSQYIERTRKALECKQRHPMTMEHQRGGDLYFKSGKDACISSNLKKKKKHLHILLNCYRKIRNEVQQDGGKRKKHCGDDK